MEVLIVIFLLVIGLGVWSVYADAEAKRKTKIRQTAQQAEIDYAKFLARIVSGDQSHHHLMMTLQAGRKAYAWRRFLAGQGYCVMHVDETSIATEIQLARQATH